MRFPTTDGIGGNKLAQSYLDSSVILVGSTIMIGGISST